MNLTNPSRHTVRQFSLETPRADFFCHHSTNTLLSGYLLVPGPDARPTCTTLPFWKQSSLGVGRAHALLVFSCLLVPAPRFWQETLSVPSFALSLSMHTSQTTSPVATTPTAPSVLTRPGHSPELKLLSRAPDLYVCRDVLLGCSMKVCALCIFLPHSPLSSELQLSPPSQSLKVTSHRCTAIPQDIYLAGPCEI